MLLNKVTRFLAVNGKLPGRACYSAIQEQPLDEKPSEKTINTVTLLGRVGNDPQLKGSDYPVVIFSLATHSVFRSEFGKITQKTDWHKICVFKPSLRDLIFNYLKKGQRIHVTGRLSYGTVKDDKETRQSTSIIADDVIFFHPSDTSSHT